MYNKGCNECMYSEFKLTLELPISHSFVHTHSLQSVERILTSLRGDDRSVFTLKRITTSFIRSLIRPNWYYGNVADLAKCYYLLVEDRDYYEDVWVNEWDLFSSHYIGHLTTAFRALSELCIERSTDYDLFRALYTSLTDTNYDEPLDLYDRLVKVFTVAYKQQIKPKITTPQGDDTNG